MKLASECNATKFSATATLEAVVSVPVPETKPPETTSTTASPPVPPPPVVKAAFSVVVSLAPGRAVLNASASVPPGTSATSYSWNITGGAHPLNVRLSNGVTQHYALGIHGSGKTRQLALAVPSYLGVSVSVAARAPGLGHRAGRRASVKLHAGPRPRGVVIKPF